tara:strand:+ start:6238 stop:10185 length:3948 start_codon:yes stop_codon:yes gene_type:complete
MFTGVFKKRKMIFYFIKNIFIFCLIFLILGDAWGYIQLNDQKETYQAWKDIKIFEDKNGELKLEEFIKKRSELDFKSERKKIPNFGINPSTFWVEFRLKNKSKINDWFLVLDYHYLDHVNFYKFVDGKWKVFRTGDRKLFKEREIEHRGFVFKIKPGNDSIYFLKLKSRGSIQIPLRIYSPTEFYKSEASTNYGFGIFSGFFVVMIFYNLFVYFSTKNISFIHYVFFLTSILLLLMGMNGFGYQYIYPFSPFLQNRGIPLIGLFVLISWGLFSKSYLNFKDGMPRLSLALNAFLYGALVFLFLSPLFSYTFLLKYSLMLFLVEALIVVPGVLLKVKEGYRPSYFYIVAFGVFIVGAVFKVLNNLGMVPSIFIFTQGLYIGASIQVVLLALGLADIINSLKKDALQKAEKLAIAKVQLEEANSNLEEKVKKRTLDLSKALNDISNLLNNMKQAVFTVDKSGMILSPVSRYSEDIFERKVEGLDVFDSLFSSLDKKSEVYSTIKFSFSIIFGADDLQWMMVKDHFPSRLIFRIDDQKEKVLRLSYSPIYNQENLIERVMFVIEDVTEVEKLEKEVEEQKIASLKNVEILQDLASNKKEDLSQFFSSATKIILESIGIAKQMRSQMERQEKLRDVNLLFRHLHTVKGTARVFNLSHISKEAHKVESMIVSIINEGHDSVEFNWDYLNGIVQGMYGLQGQLNEYLKAAKNVFAFEFDDDIKFKQKLHEQLKNFEYLISQLLNDEINLNNPIEKEDLKEFVLNTQRDEKIRNKIIEELLILSHNLKGLSRGMDERILSDTIHRFEGGILLFDQNFSEDNIQEWDDLFFGPLKDINNISYHIYLSSDKLSEFEFKREEFSNLIFDIYEVTQNLLKEDPSVNIPQNIYRLHSKAFDLGIEYIPATLRELYSCYEEKIINKDIILNKLREIWEYLSFIMILENNKIYNEKERIEIVNTLNKEEEIKKIEKLNSDSVLIIFLRSLNQKGIPTKNVIEVLEKIFQVERQKVLKKLLIQKSISKQINEMYFEFKKGIGEENIKSLKSFLKQEKIPVLDIIEWVSGCRYSSGINYLKNLDIIQGLNYFSSFYDDQEKQIKPKTYEVLVKNFNDSFDYLFSLIEKGKKFDLEDLNKSFDKLLYLPIKYSFLKFGPVVKDVSKSLGKKVKFRVVGDEESLEKERLGLLQDALTHLVRNSIDHGIEVPSLRSLNGKDEMGVIEIECLKKSESILQIILKDDGGGIDINRICEKAIKNNVMTKDDLINMSDKDKLELIFLPNFSTKEEVSEISGRGVGMDVVKKNIEILGAELEVVSNKDKGTQFIIELTL